MKSPITSRPEFQKEPKVAVMESDKKAKAEKETPLAKSKRELLEMLLEIGVPPSAIPEAYNNVMNSLEYAGMEATPENIREIVDRLRNGPYSAGKPHGALYTNSPKEYKQSVEDIKLIDDQLTLPFARGRDPVRESQDFQKWFEGSQVLDESGNPLRVYHGTRFNFSSFNPEALGRATEAPSAGLGFFFSRRPRTAEDYAQHMVLPEEKEKYHAMREEADALTQRYWRGYSRRKKPESIARAKEDYERAQQLIRESAEMTSQGGNVMPVYLSMKNPFVYDMKGKPYREKSYYDIVQQAKQAGHDGVIIRNTYDAMLGDGKPDDIFVVFEPTQIKSAIGNKGTFDPNDPDITKSDIDEVARLPHGTAVRGAEDHELGQLHNSESLKKEEEDDLLKLPPAEALNRLIDEVHTGSNRSLDDISKLSNYLIGKLSLDEVREFLKEGLFSPVRLLENPNVTEDMVQAALDQAVRTPSLIKQYFKSPKLGPQALRTALNSSIPVVRDAAFYYLYRYVAEIPEMYDAIIRDGDPRLIDIVMKGAKGDKTPWEDRRKWALDPRSSSATKFQYISDLLDLRKPITPEDESLIEKMYKEDSPHARTHRRWTIPLLPKRMVKKFEQSLEGLPAWEDLVLSPHFSNKGWKKLSSDPKRLHRVLSEIVSWSEKADRFPKIPSWVIVQNPGSIPREFIFATNDPESLKALALHSEENAETVLERMQQWEPSDWEQYRDVIASIRRAHPYLKNVGQVSKILTDPSSYSPDSVSVRYRTASLRRFREAIAAAGGQTKKRDLEQRTGRQWPKALNPLLGPKGEITAESIDRYIESMPSTKYLVSHGVWSGEQRHSDDDSKVFRLNITNDHVTRLKEAGVFDVFKEFVDKASLSHPYDPHTIGWIRWTGEPGKGIFIDEVQSDFTRHPADQAKAFALRNNPNISPEKLEETIKRIENKYPRDQWDTMIGILFGGQDPNETLYEAFWQWNRDKGFTGTPVAVHTPSSKAVKALSAPYEEVPAHFRNTYDKIPKRFGMQQRQYGEGFSEEGEALRGKPVFHDLLRSEEAVEVKPDCSHDGVYRIYYHYDHERYGPQRRLHSRFVIHNGVIHHLEDHFGHLDSMMPEGNLDNRHKRQLARLLTSRCFELINEDDIMAGECEDEIPEFDPGLTLSDAQFWMISKDGGEPQKVEVQGDVVTIDGIKLTDEEAEKLIFCIQNGLVQLKEIAPQTSLQKNEETKQPQVFYHGTAADFDEFDLSYAGSNTKTPGANRAIFFAANPSAASYYAQLSHDKLKQKWEEEKAAAEYLNKPFDKPPPKIRTIAAHLDIRNPLVLGYEHDSNVDPDVYYELMDDDEKALQYAWLNGHDAVVWPYGNMTNEGHTVAVFSPEQIRQVDKDFKAKSQKEIAPQSLQKMALADNPPGKKVSSFGDGEVEHWDYSHLLPEELRNQGLTIHGNIRQGYGDFSVRKRGEEVGKLTYNMFPGPKDLRIENFEVKPTYQKKGLGMALMEALLTHSKNVLGVKEVSGGLHSTGASKVHQKLAAKHGMDYIPTPAIGEGYRYKTKEEWEKGVSGPYDDKYGRYRYTLKSEEADD